MHACTALAVQLDSARNSSLFDTTFAPPFAGRDGRSYQRWRLAKDDLRRRASYQNLSKQLLEPKPPAEVAQFAAPLAHAQLPMATALSTPTLKELELRSLRDAAAGQASVLDPWACDERVGMREVVCVTPKRQALATLRLALRLREDVVMSVPLLAALTGMDLTLPVVPLSEAEEAAPAGVEAAAPAGQAPLKRSASSASGFGVAASAAPPLPHGHWAAALAAEEMALAPLVERMQGAVLGACASIMGAAAPAPPASTTTSSAAAAPATAQSSLQDALQQGQGE